MILRRSFQVGLRIGIVRREDNGRSCEVDDGTTCSELLGLGTCCFGVRVVHLLCLESWPSFNLEDVIVESPCVTRWFQYSATYTSPSSLPSINRAQLLARVSLLY